MAKCSKCGGQWRIDFDYYDYRWLVTCDCEIFNVHLESEFPNEVRDAVAEAMLKAGQEVLDVWGGKPSKC